jgi:hypothetical protein
MNIYKQFNTTDDIIKSRSSIVTAGIWSGDTGSLTTFFTSSAQVASVSGKYYIDVYNKSTGSSDAEVQFSIAYGDVDGYGAPTISQDDFSTLPTKAVYSQYKNILDPESGSYFRIYNGTTADGRDMRNFYAININRARYKERLDPGNLSIELKGAVRNITLIDDSGDSDGTTGFGGRVFNVVSGSLNIGSAATATINSYTASNGQGWGKFYPDLGVVLLNPAALSSSCDVSLQPATSSVTSVYHLTRGANIGGTAFFNAISGGMDFQARRTENISSTYYFVRANSRDFNYSNNPSFVSSSAGVEGVTLFSLYSNTPPKTYPTSIGLYDSNNVLVAVAKMSKPVEKSFEKEIAVRVKLDF